MHQHKNAEAAKSSHVHEEMLLMYLFQKDTHWNLLTRMYMLKGKELPAKHKKILKNRKMKLRMGLLDLELG